MMKVMVLVVVVQVMGLPVEFDVWGDGSTKENGVGERNLYRMPRVLNFFPVPFVEECKAKDERRRGICMNTYECRIQGGKSHGPCALGFGVCCVFTATCNGIASNNLTYLVNPDFPDLSTKMSTCSLTIKKIDPEVAQIRLDFIHFNLGQPNRKTGICDEDVFQLTAPNTSRTITMCGLNNGQHVYFDVDNVDKINIEMTLNKKAVNRIWEIIVTQVGFPERAPPECLQYFTGATGTIQTMNFADNGRHLADQDYTICIRQEWRMCSITYEPCHVNAFRISPNTDLMVDINSLDEGSGEVDQSLRSLDNMCNDKIILPCDSEELLMPGLLLGSCSMFHCGSTLCPSGATPCVVESSATPFNVGVFFGESNGDSSPEDNLGVCLNYEQVECEG